MPTARTRAASSPANATDRAVKAVRAAGTPPVRAATEVAEAAIREIVFAAGTEKEKVAALTRIKETAGLNRAAFFMRVR